MPRRNGSYFGYTVSPTPSVASGIWRVSEAEQFLRVNKWPATPGVPGSPVGTLGDGQVSLTWSAPTLGSPPTDYQIQYSSNSGATWTTFSDGTSAATSATVTGLTNGTAYVFRVRAANVLGEGPYGAASGTVTPSELNVVLLLHMDGTNGSTAFTDSSNYAQQITSAGGAAITTSQSKFGGAFATGYQKYLEWTHGGALNFAANEDFTIEAWMYPNENSAYSGLIDARSANEFGFFACGIMNNGDGYFPDFVDNNNQRLTTASSVNLNEWSHIAWVRRESTLRCYINGIQDENVISMTGPRVAVQSVARIGAVYDPIFFDGYIDEFRIVKGTAVYTENFTPPTAPF